MKDKIVIIDDDVQMVEILKEVLTENGYKVFPFTDPQKVTDDIRKILPSLIMLDIHMPVKNGIEVLKEIKKDPVLKKIPVIMLTVEASPSEIELSLLHGANTYILKPAKKEDILNIVKNILSV